MAHIEAYRSSNITQWITFWKFLEFRSSVEYATAHPSYWPNVNNFFAICLIGNATAYEATKSGHTQVQSREQPTQGELSVLFFNMSTMSKWNLLKISWLSRLPAASPDGLWYGPSSDNDLALPACIKYPYRTVSNALTYLQHSATSPRASIFYFDKAWRFWSNWHIAKPQRHNRCLQQSGVYSLPQIETTMFIADNGRADCGDMSGRHSCTGVGVIG